MYQPTSSWSQLSFRRRRRRWREEQEEKVQQRRVKGGEAGGGAGDMDICHSSSHSTVAAVTKGTLIYPISRSLRLSHNVTASCSPVTFLCVWERREREDEFVSVRDSVNETECFHLCVCAHVCVHVRACAYVMTVQLVALLWKWHVPAKLISLLSEFNGPVLPSYLKQNIPLSTSITRCGGVGGGGWEAKWAGQCVKTVFTYHSFKEGRKINFKVNKQNNKHKKHISHQWSKEVRIHQDFTDLFYFNACVKHILCIQFGLDYFSVVCLNFFFPLLLC